MMSMNISEEDALYTPRRAQKCLFGIKNSSKRKTIYRNEKDNRNADNSSGEESDLGPMSPLALTDQSPTSCTSSPKSECMSPCTTPKRSLSSPYKNALLDHSALDKSRNSSNNTTLRRSFCALNKLTRTARYSPQQAIKSKITECVLNTSLNNSNSETPKHVSMTSIRFEEIIPETPHRHFGREIQNNIVETPNKSNSPEHKLITPLGSESKLIPLPKLNRRKSFSTLDTNNDSSPKKRTSFKRHACEQLGNSSTKLQKLDENSPIPKARAALFQEKESEEKLKDFTVSTVSFYGSSEKKKTLKIDDGSIEKINKKRISPVHSANHRRSLKKPKMGEINAGVSHGIKKRKAKLNSEDLKRNISNITQKAENIGEVMQMTNKIKKTNALIAPAEETLTLEIDSNKRFFKTKRVISKDHLCTPTTKNKVMPKIAANSKLALNHNKLEQKNFQAAKPLDTQTKVVEMAFDTTDLIMDEPELEVAIEESKVANILKVLEDDWANDDYDTMEILTDKTSTNASPIKTLTILKDVTMSPASELSNMTSTMNIEDVTVPTLKNLSFNDTKSNNTALECTQKYYPLFSKGYNITKNSEYIDTKKSTHSVKENMSVKWQLSAKQTGGENQYQLDAGQKYFGATQCPDCGVVYQLGDPEDENAHLNYHNSKNIFKFPGWKTEHIVMEDPFTSSRIIMVQSDDSKQYWNKVSQILDFIDRDLGLADSKLSNYQQKKVYLYIRDKSVLGVLVAEYIKTAHRMIPELLELDCCTAESTPAKCGINVVWTAISHRKQGIATKMVDALRTQFYYGYVMSLDDIAFSIPTPSGKIFAEKYTKTRNFKVYS